MDGAQTSLFKTAKDFGEISEKHASQLEVLACGDVATSFIPVSLDNGSDHAKLIGRQHAIRNSQPQHEFARGLRAPKHAVPLQAQLKVCFVDLLPAQFRKFFNLAAHKQAIFGCFVLLDLVELLAIQIGPGGRAESHDLDTDRAD